MQEEDELNTLSISEGMGKQMQSDAGTMDNLKEEMKKIQQKLNNLKTKTPHTASECIDIKDIQNEIDLLLVRIASMSPFFSLFLIFV